jgi:trk system potassium uptake protein TrkA
MKNFAIVGLGRFGQCMLDALIARGRHVVVIDRNDEKIQQVRDTATKAIKADALQRKLFEEVLPAGVDCAIVDLGDQLQASILVTNYLSKLKVPQIIVEAANPEHAEILQIVGATKTVLPEEEAAKRLAGILVGHGVLDYFAVSEDFSMIEIPVPEPWVGKTVVNLKLRQEERINVVARRKQLPEEDEIKWRFPDPDAPFERSEIVLLAGKTKDLERVQR